MVISTDSTKNIKDVSINLNDDRVPNQQSGLTFALFMMFDAIDTRRSIVEMQIYAISASADSQRDLNRRISQIEYVSFPQGVNGQPPTNEQIQEVNSRNAQLNLVRSNLESQVMTVRQGAQMQMTYAQSSISTQQIYISQTSNALNVLNVIAKKTNQMNERFA